ncbi:hypothetical protein I8751_27090 [Nostocaceae cyanobacterium CENA357]|uniref:Uncharacterized protein n=1 Tax=Atlanticothrix silvestris CENA357 TaxID=1725252 RepID=A0A8J7HPJ5_9CYAN|nr:hypothetical protein [Atlanticothrix silvestris]MBH8555940.1 hypothetical protein [Atlanticothrix silvestris CENA357]
MLQVGIAAQRSGSLGATGATQKAQRGKYEDLCVHRSLQGGITTLGEQCPTCTAKAEPVG